MDKTRIQNLKAVVFYGGKIRCDSKSRISVQRATKLMKYKFWILIRDTLSFTETRVLKRHLIQKAQVKRDSYLRKWITRQAKLQTN
jgi:hypothetical protein